MTGGWDALWAARQPPASGIGASLLRRLMDADGMDSGFARVEEPAWRAFVTRAATALELRPGESVFEVGCGAGAFVAPLREAGYAVGGIDRSPGLVELACASDLGGDFAVADASELDVTPCVDVVVSMGVFLYFRSEHYVEEVLDRMVRKARRAVAVLDLPDAATRAAALAERERLAGGPGAYAARYAGLEHRYFDRARVAEALRARGLTRVRVEDQAIDGYGNAPFRFNAWGFKEPEPGVWRTTTLPSR